MKFIFGMQRNSKTFYKLVLSFWLCASRYAQSTQNRKFAYLFNISTKTRRMKLLLPADKYEIFLQSASIILE